MPKSHNIELAPSGYYHLRIQRNGINRRISLKTRNLAEAELASAIMRATLSAMTIDTNKIKSWTLATNANTGEITLKTDGTDADNASAERVAEKFANAYIVGNRSNYTDLDTPKVALTLTISEALSEYYQVLEKSTIADKTKAMARSTLAALSLRLGGGFNIGAANLQDEIEEKWINERLQKVARPTVKRELSFIRGFVEFCAKKKYATTKLDLSIHAENVHYEYFSATDLKSIFDNALSITGFTASSKIWLMLLGLYTGARLGQICDIELSFFEKVGEVHVLNFKIKNKNKASVRKVPIHNDLINLGLLDYVEKQKKKGRVKLIQISSKKASKFFTDFKRTCGIFDENKVFHSFRSTCVDCLKQCSVSFEERCQYVGHDSGGGVHNQVYARNEFSIEHMKLNCTDKMSWQKYCSWQPNFEALSAKLSTFN